MRKISYLCDRCSKEFNYISNRKREFRVIDPVEDYVADLCMDCQEELDTWMKGPEYQKNTKGEEDEED